METGGEGHLVSRDGQPGPGGKASCAALPDVRTETRPAGHRSRTGSGKNLFLAGGCAVVLGESPDVRAAAKFYRRPFFRSGGPEGGMEGARRRAYTKGVIKPGDKQKVDDHA